VILTGSLIFSLVKNTLLLFAVGKERRSLPSFDPKLPSVPFIYVGEGWAVKVAGLLTPRIVVGRETLKTLDEEKLAAVLLHEHYHLKTKDNWFRFLALIFRDAFFWVPAVISFFNSYLREREKAADEYAARVTAKPLKVAEAILELWGKGLGLPPLIPQSSFAAEVNQERLENLLRDRHPLPRLRSGQGGNGQVAVILAGLILMAFVAAAFVFPARGSSDPAACHTGGRCAMVVPGACCPR